MKTIFKAYNETAKDEVREIYFRVIMDGNLPTLIACDKNGEILHGGCILTITQEGCLRLSEGVSPKDTGLSVTKSGQVIIEKPSELHAGVWEYGK